MFPILSLCLSLFLLKDKHTKNDEKHTRDFLFWVFVIFLTCVCCLLTGERETKKRHVWKADLRRLGPPHLPVLCVVSLFLLFCPSLRSWVQVLHTTGQCATFIRFFLLLLVCCFVLYKPKISSLDVTNLKELSEPRESSKGRQKSRESVCTHAHSWKPIRNPPPPPDMHFTHTNFWTVCVCMCVLWIVSCYASSSFAPSIAVRNTCTSITTHRHHTYVASMKNDISSFISNICTRICLPLARFVS